MKVSFHWKPLLATLIWGGSYSAIKAGINEINPIVFAGLGVLIATSLLSLISFMSGKLKFSEMNLRELLLANLAQFCFQITFVFGLSQTTASNSAILLATAPIITLITASVFQKQFPQNDKFLALALGFIGVILVIGISGKNNYLLGNFLALGSAVAWSWYSLALKPLTQKHGSLIATPLAMCLSLVCFTPYALLHFPQLASLAAWGGLLYNSVGGLVIAMLLWNQAMSEIEANKVMVYTYFEPVVALVISAIFIKEQMLFTQIIGCLMILSSIYLTERS